MPQPLPFALGQELVRRPPQGETLASLAESMQIPPATVRNGWQRFRRAGEAGLQTRYQRCGPQGPKVGPAVHEAALAMQREHPPWGAGLIRLELQKQFPDQPLPQKRAIERWIQKAGRQPPRAQRPPMERQRGKEPHAVWEIDAKERLRLGDGSATRVLSVTDEASGALLGATPFPPRPREPGGTSGGAAGAAGAVGALGLAGADPGGQRRPLGERGRPAATGGALVAGIGDRGDLEPPALPERERQGRALQRHLVAVGGAGAVCRHRGVGGEAGGGGAGAAGGGSGGRRSAPAGCLSALGGPAPPRCGGTGGRAVGAGTDHDLPGARLVAAAGVAAGADLPVWESLSSRRAAWWQAGVGAV
jgi:hypothetical protein